MRNSSVFIHLPTYLLLFVALSLMWSCEKEVALEDFQAAPAEVEIVARKTPPINEGPTPGSDCGGCYLQVLQLIPTGSTITVAAFDDNNDISYACPETNSIKRFEQVISATGNYNINGSSYSGDYRLAFKKSGVSNVYLLANLRCRGSSSLGGENYYPIRNDAPGLSLEVSWNDYRFIPVGSIASTIPPAVSTYTPGCSSVFWGVCPLPDPGL